jgi:uncharacterized protein YbjQ (UPF0145 family)
MLLSTPESLPGKKTVGHSGMISGSTIRAKHTGKDFLVGLKNIFGGELKGYTKLPEESRGESPVG